VIAEPELRHWRRRASALLIPVVLAVMLAVFWPGPVAAASAAAAQSGSQASPSPAKVKYYIVPSAGRGSAESLYVIAARTLGDGSRYKEIFSLNKGRLQPNGGRLENPGVIEPGWILKLPADATGPGVHFGVLPTSPKKAANPVTHQQTRSAAAPSAAPGWVDPAGVIVVGMAIAGLAFGLVRRRRRGGKSGRKHAARRTRPGRASHGPGSPAPTRIRTPTADFQGPDMGWLDAINESAWREWGSAPALHPDHPSAPQPRIDRRAGSWDGPAGPTGQAGLTAPSAPGGPGGPGGSGGPAALGGPATTMLTEPHRVDGYLATAVGTRGQPGLQLVGRETTALVAPMAWDASDLRAADSLWLAHRVLAEADQRAAEVTLHAQGQATSIRAAAHQEAAEIRQQASDQAAALLAAAEWDAAQMRTAVLTMSAELSQIAAYVTENLTSIPARPATRPAAQPAAKPAVQPAAKPAAQPTARPRQSGAMRRVVSVVAALVLLAVVSGATELGLHGFRFFVFRSAGTGATPSGGLKEDQGPGQPHAPKPHIHVLIPHQAQRSPKPTKAAGGSNG
jgi:hypothetical protein